MTDFELDDLEERNVALLAENKRLRKEVERLEAAWDGALILKAENKWLREAGAFMLGWHPTDPEHPAFTRTVEYGREMMMKALKGESE